MLDQPAPLSDPHKDGLPQPSRLPVLSELGIVLCLGAIAAFRMASCQSISALSASAMLVATLSAAGASFRPSNDGTRLRRLLHERHRDGLAVGSLCVPITCASLMVGDPANELCARAFWLATTCSLLVCLRLLAPVITPSNPDAIASTFGWASCLGASLGTAGIGVIPSASAAIAFDVLGRALLSFLPLSIGELCVIGEGLIILADLAIGMVYKAIYQPAVVPLTDDAEIASIILIVLLSGTALAAIALWPVFCKYARKNFDVEAPGSPTVPLSVCAFVYAVLFSVMAYLETPVLTAVMGQDPFVWAGAFMSERPSRGLWAVYWIACITCLVQFAPTSASTAIPNIVARKFFHFVAVAMFAPVVLVDYQLMRLAFVVAVMGLLFAEFMRVIRLPYTGVGIHNFMKKFIDCRDAGHVTLTHLYLLLGCALPVWLPAQPSSALAGAISFSGILILGVGDAAAAVCGTYFGRSKWPGTRKSLEGTAAGFLSVLVTIWVIHRSAHALGLDTHIIRVKSFEVIQFSVAAAAVCLLETFTTQVDNLILPLYFFSALVLLCPAAV